MSPRRQPLGALAAFALLALFSASAWGQSPPLTNPGSSGSSLDLEIANVAPGPRPPKPGEYVHDGFYFRYAVGATFVHMSGDGPAGAVSDGGVGVGELIAFGGTPAKGLVLGGAVVSHLAPLGSGSLATTATYGVLVDWFPDVTAGWHVGGVVGLGSTTYGVGNARAFTVGASAFGGYDFWIAPQWSFGAQLALSTAPEAPSVDHGPSDPYHLMPVALALEATVLCH